jgi:spore coat polysaccharide biosynthesis predicted glycosyltransferase SpsG
MNIAIRVCNHFDQGIGHVMRMNHLAVVLLNAEAKIVFILDKQDAFFQIF